MRVALISDIHGNEIASNAVLAAIEKEGADRIICLGDVATLGPRPNAVIQRLSELGCPCIQGNHDAFLLDPEFIHAYTDVPVIIEAVDWCRRQLSDTELDFLRTFQPGMEVSLDQDLTLALYHGSPRSCTEDILSTTPPDDLDRLLGDMQATVLAGGHTHIQMLRQHEGRFIVNPGSVGLPFKAYIGGKTPIVLAHAEYAMVEAQGGGVRVHLHRVPLDRTALQASVWACDNPLCDYLREQYAG